MDAPVTLVRHLYLNLLAYDLVVKIAHVSKQQSMMMKIAINAMRSVLIISSMVESRLLIL